jgi:hypothetical protein
LDADVSERRDARLSDRHLERSRTRPSRIDGPAQPPARATSFSVPGDCGSQLAQSMPARDQSPALRICEDVFLNRRQARPKLQILLEERQLSIPLGQAIFAQPVDVVLLVAPGTPGMWLSIEAAKPPSTIMFWPVT